jgi:hypothetical protein
MTSLVDRYVVTALRRVPEQQRTDIDRELRASIADAVDAMVDAGETYDATVERALLALGDPNQLADSYAGRRTYLLGPEFFGAWRRLLTMLYTVVLPIIIASVIVAEVIDGASFGETVGTVLTAVLTAGVHLAFWTTLVFVVFERTGLDRKQLGMTWHPENLPEYKKGTGANAQLVVDLSWIALLIAGLALQQVTFTDEPVLNPANWSSWWPYLIGILVLKGAHAVWVHRASVRTHAMTAVNAVLALATAGPIIWLLANDRFLNPAQDFSRLADGTAKQWTSRVLIALVAVIALWDIVDQALRTERSRKPLSTKIPGAGITS